MWASLHLALVASSLVSAVPFHFEYLPEKRSAPVNPIAVSSADFLCNVTSDLPVYRDLGFVGSIEYTTVYTFGDTTRNDTSAFFMTSDSSSIGTDDPCHVLNTQRTSDGQHPTDMIAPSTQWSETEAEDAFGGTNVLPTGGNGGMMFFLKNHRPSGVNNIIGAGVATVTLSDTKNITTSRLAEYWWDASAGEPWYGDVGAFTDGTYVYGYGHGHSDHMYVYITRALISGWQDLNNWEYWDGSTSSWSSNRLYNPSIQQSMQWNDVDGAVWAVGQGQMIWNAYYNKIIWVYGIDWADDASGNFGVYARTADRPEGPWSSKIELYKVQRLTPDRAVYAMVANPYFDESGKSIIVTVDNGSNTIQASKVVFK